MLLEVDVCVAGATTDGRINGSLSFILVAGRVNLEETFSFDTLKVVPLSLDREHEMFLLADVSEDFDVALDSSLLSFTLVNSVVAISTSLGREMAVCEGARLCSMPFHVYSSFNFGGLLSLQ